MGECYYVLIVSIFIKVNCWDFRTVDNANQFPENYLYHCMI